MVAFGQHVIRMLVQQQNTRAARSWFKELQLSVSHFTLTLGTGQRFCMYGYIHSQLLFFCLIIQFVRRGFARSMINL